MRNLPYDCISQESPLRLLYNNLDLCEFLRQVLSQPKLYTLADPLGACSVNIFKDGENFSWHYDQATFSTTIMLQKPEEGGLFQLTGPIRESPVCCYSTYATKSKWVWLNCARCKTFLNQFNEGLSLNSSWTWAGDSCQQIRWMGTIVYDSFWNQAN